MIKQTKVIGYLNAHIPCETRFTSSIEVTSDGITANVARHHSGIGAQIFPARTCPATPKDIIKAIKREIAKDDVLRDHGKASKRFVWVPVLDAVQRGLSAAKCKAALDYYFA